MPVDDAVPPTGELWRFACTLYAAGRVKELCLYLQDTCGASVDVVLWLCWLHSRGQRLPKSILSQALQRVGGVSEQLLDGLRGMRGTQLRRSGYTLEQQKEVCSHLLAAELAIEAILLEQLQALSLRCMGADGGDAVSLADYIHMLCPSESASIAHELLAATDRLGRASCS